MIALAVTATVLATFVVACGGGSDGETVATPTVREDQGRLAREPAPAIEGVSLDGETVSLADFRGRPVLVNIWSSW
jgi:cytochrome oxidase Cu insertion factor (SCO1/SenC/PrrC family)